MKAILTMPCYNEADGISDFLADIDEHLVDLIDLIVIVDDCSSDDTVLVIENYIGQRSDIKCFSNTTNLGHGPTFLNSIKFALSLNPDIVITVDGDGQFHAREIRDRLIQFKGGEMDLLECARTNRADPVFRKIITFLLRIFVWSRVAILPLDSNTPLRIYNGKVLRELVTQMPSNSLIPNIRFSTLARKNMLNYSEALVESIPRRGLSASGSTWKSKRDFLPSSRFLKFCRNALLELWRNPV